MEKNQIIEIKIIDQSKDGNGIGRSGGIAVFVSGCVCGDLVRAKVTKVKKRYAFAEAIEILEESKDRTDDVCPYIDACGGCTLGKLTYEAQLRLKEKHVYDVLERIGGIDAPEVKPIISMDMPYNYRNKATLAVDTQSGKVGFLGRASHKVIDCYDCRIQAEPVMAAASALREALIENEDARKIKKLVVKTSLSSGEVMVMPTIYGKAEPMLDEFIYKVNDKINEIPAFDNGFEYSLESFALDCEEKKGGNLVHQSRILAGKHVICDRLLNLDFEISPYSFYQVNPQQAENLYIKALEYADIKGGETVLDLYCGVGTIGLFMASAGAGKVIGIEVVKDAVLNANRNAVINKIVNAIYYTGRAEEVLPKLKSKGEIESVNVVILDPPRKGCDEKLLKTIAEIGTEKIVYVSCDSATLSRDIKILCELGYDFVEATPVDMFPHTSQIETVALLSNLNR